MWQVDKSNIENLIGIFDEFISEFLDWAVKHNLKQKRTLRRLLKHDTSNLSVLTKEMPKVRELLIECTRSKYIEEISNAYSLITVDYFSFLENGAKAPALSKEAKILANRVFSYFYNGVFDSKKFWVYFAEKDPLSKNLFRRKVGSLNSVCPYCDAAKISFEKKSNTDHFLAFTHFPYLSMYWQNLVVSCSGCNTYIKNAKAIGTLNGFANNVPIFHPYFNQTADHLTFSFKDRKVALNLSADPSVKKHAINFCNVFELKKQYENSGMWDELKSMINLIIYVVEDKYKYNRLSGESDKDRLNRVIKEVLNDFKQNIYRAKGKEMLSKLKTDLCEYYLNDGFSDFNKDMSIQVGIINPRKTISSSVKPS